MYSASQIMSSANWVDAHYLACQPEYEAMIRSVGLQAGWNVLDAGCGTGQFMSVIAKLIGQHGKISGVDVAPENVTIAQAKAALHQFLCPVEVQVADIKALPFPDQMFDAIWSANVAQYFDDRQLGTALGELRRVLKPGGLLAMKDGDITALQIFPIPPTTLWRLLDAWERRMDQQILGLLRSVGLADCLRRAGLSEVKCNVTLIERTAPLQPPEARFVGGLIEYFVNLVPSLNLPASDVEYWREISNSQSPNYILKRPELYVREAAVLAVGVKPSA
jgi:arsenite methyltransferase